MADFPIILYQLLKGSWDTLCNSLTVIINFLFSYEFLFLTETISLGIKIIVLVMLFRYITNSKKFRTLWLFLVLSLVASTVEDIAWIIKILKDSIPEFDQYLWIAFIRVSWVFALINYQSLALFVENLTKKDIEMPWRTKLSITVTGIICVILIYLTVFEFYAINPRPALEHYVLSRIPMYLFVLITSTMFFAIKSIQTAKTPAILKQQIRVLILGLIAPRLISDCIQIGLEIFKLDIFIEPHVSNNLAVGLSSLLITGAAFYCTNKILKLRFLNIKNHVQSLSATKFNFINDFRGTLEQLSHSSTARELTITIKDFFHKAFQIPSGRTALYFRTLDQNNPQLRPERAGFKPLTKTVYAEPDELRTSLVENFFSNDSEVQKYLLEKRILIYDEIEFSNFYDDNQVRKKILSFLEQINAEIFIPIYQEGSVGAYIVIERDPKRKELYSDLDRDEMIVFASYLENTINLLQKQNVDTLILREKELREELFLKQQEVQQYKESLRSFLKQPHKKIGILFYKNRSFVFANQEAKELLKINPNVQENSPLAQQLRRLARQVLEYKAAQNGLAYDSTGQQLVIIAVPNLEQNNVILTVTYPELADIVKQQIDKLYDPSRWDYLLYLETTESGRLINQLIPGSGEQLLNFKLSLLQLALSKKALLLSVPEADVLNTVEIIHHISLRQKLHVLDIQTRSTNFDLAVKLFGINSIFGKRPETPPLLQSLHNGTLLIKNIDFLDLETQNYLAEFVRYGFYHVFKSDQKESSDVRIIGTTNQDLRELVREGRFSTELYQELKEATLSMPSLLTLPESELNELIDTLSAQFLGQRELDSLVSLSDKQRKKLLSKEIVSIAEFKNRVQRLLTEKAQEQALVPALQVDTIVRTADPELIEIAKLGKHALKDPKIMQQLWQKFQNQNKIAAFLGVNRSSVHRRCKDYNLA